MAQKQTKVNVTSNNNNTAYAIWMGVGIGFGAGVGIGIGAGWCVGYFLNASFGGTVQLRRLCLHFTIGICEAFSICFIYFYTFFFS